MHILITCLYFSLYIGHYIILHHVLYFIHTIVRLSHSLQKATSLDHAASRTEALVNSYDSRKRRKHANESMNASAKT